MPARKPNLKIKGQSGFRHDLFKAKLNTFKKNVSFIHGAPRIEEVEHVHFYHSHNSQGRQQAYTNSVGNHFHEIKVSMDSKGNLVAECGPPLTKTYRRLRNGNMKSEIVPVTWYDMDADRNIVDNHTHDMDYIHSEELNSNKIENIRVENASQIAQSTEDMYEVGSDASL